MVETYASGCCALELYSYTEENDFKLNAEAFYAGYNSFGMAFDITYLLVVKITCGFYRVDVFCDHHCCVLANYLSNLHGYVLKLLLCWFSH